LLSHLRSCERYDEPETLPSSICQFCLTSADGGHLDKAKALQAARSLVEFITGRAWVMYDVGPNVFKFTHRTFLEYFFARHLLSSSESIAVLIRTRLLPRIRNSEWDVIAHLALQTAVFRDAGKMIQAADTVASILANPFADARSEIAFLSFVAKALEYLLLPERRYYEIVKAVLQSAIHIGATSNPAAVFVVSGLIASTRKREEIARPAIYEVIRRSLKSSNRSPERVFSMFIIGADYSLPYLFVRRVTDASGLFDAPLPSWEVARSNGAYFEPLRNEFQSFNLTRAQTHPAEARIYIYTYRREHDELFRKFGFDALYGGDSGVIWNAIPDLIQLSILQRVTREYRYSNVEKSTSPHLNAFLDRMFLTITEGKKVIVAPHYSIRSSEELINAVVHAIYDVATHTKRPDVPLVVKALLLLALSLDIGTELVRPKIDEEYRLLSFMPDGAMDEMLNAVKSDPLAPLLNSWNERKVQFAALP
jgi:hypothetical protein